MDNIGRTLEAMKLRLTAGNADVEGIFGHVTRALEGHCQLNGRTHEWTAETALGAYYDDEENAFATRFGAVTQREREALLNRLEAWIEGHQDSI